jgi:hypothetical protein
MRRDLRIKTKGMGKTNLQHLGAHLHSKLLRSVLHKSQMLYHWRTALVSLMSQSRKWQELRRVKLISLPVSDHQNKFRQVSASRWASLFSVTMMSSVVPNAATSRDSPRTRWACATHLTLVFGFWSSSCNFHSKLTSSRKSNPTHTSCWHRAVSTSLWC